MIFDHAAKELNKALLHRQQQFSDKDLYFELSPEYTPPQIALKKAANSTIIKLSIVELLEDPAIQQQLNKIPKILKKQINWSKLIAYINQQLLKELEKGHSIEVYSGQKKPTIRIKKGQQIIKESVTLNSLFS